LLKAAGVREGGYGLAIVNKTPHVELLTPQELSRQIGCGLVLVIPPAGDQLASNRSASPFFSNSPNTSFSECIYEAAKRFCADPIRFVRF
jgi:hypothetical protein